MYTVKNYVMAESLEEAYALKKKSRNNIIVGGNLWLKMGHRTVQNAIDLSLLGLDRIEETEEGFRIGCMVTLRDLELCRSLNETYQNLFAEAVKHIVGVQFRNCATVGGSIFPRFGFSDVLTAFLACDTYVDLYHAGRIPLKEFADMEVDQDILTHIYVKKDVRRVDYQSFRMTETDFPALTCAVIEKEGSFSAVIGARPHPACLVEGMNLVHPEQEEERDALARRIADSLEYGSNMRGSAQYRKELARILVGRGLARLLD